MVAKVVVPGYFKFQIVNSLGGLIFQKRSETHYIGGAEILPAPLDADMETEMIGKLGTEEDSSARASLIEHESEAGGVHSQEV